jgi:hypothetical protein
MTDADRDFLFADRLDKTYPDGQVHALTGLTLGIAAGAYVAHTSFADGRDAYLHFPGRSRREVVVLSDPRGFADGAVSEVVFRVCQDVEVVVQAVRHYCKTGGLDPSLQWEVLRDDPSCIDLQPKHAEPGAPADRPRD